MQIYTVSSGDSINTIARRYGVTENAIVTANKLNDPSNLVVGQTLVIPTKGTVHVIKPGDSLYALSKRYGVPVYSIQLANGFANPRDLQVGMSIIIPDEEKPIAEVAAYIDPLISGDKSASYVEEVGDDLTYVNIFSYHVTADGSIEPIENDEPIINAAYKKRVAPLMVLTNFAEGQFSTEIATAIFKDEAIQDKLLDEAIRLMKQKGYLGLDFDFEYLGAQNRVPYVNFLKKAKSRLKAEDERYILTVALAPIVRENQVGVLYEGHDYKAIGEVVDFVFFMTYEWGWSGGPPRAVSPLNEVRKVMDYAIARVPNDKIMMGMPLYGYDWILPYVEGGKFAKSIGFTDAVDLARKYNQRIEYDTTAQSPYFRYRDEEGKEHEVWFEDARSLQAKFNLVKELGLRGFFYWVLAREAPQNWLLVDNNFVVNKVI